MSLTRDITRISGSSRLQLKLLASDFVLSLSSWTWTVALVAFLFFQTNSLAWAAAGICARFAGQWGVAALPRLQKLGSSSIAPYPSVLLLIALAIAASRNAPLGLLVGIGVVASGLASAQASGTSVALSLREGQWDAVARVQYSIRKLGFVTGAALAAVPLLVSTSAAFLVAAAVHFALVALSSATTSQADSQPPSRMKDLRLLVKDRDVTATAAFIAISGWITGQLFLALVSSASTPSAFAFMALCFGLGQLLGGLLAGRIRNLLRAMDDLRWGSLGAGLGVMTIGVSPSLPGGIAAGILAGAGIAMILKATTSLLSRLLEHKAATPGALLTSLTFFPTACLGAIFGAASIGAVGRTGASALSVVVLIAIATGGGSVIKSSPRLGRPWVGNLDARVQILRKVGVLQGVGSESLERLAKQAEDETYSGGQEVIREGKFPDRFYVVRAGILDVVSTGESGVSQVSVNVLQEGDHFGEIGLLEGMPSTATVIARSDAQLLSVKGQDFLRAVSESPKLPGALLAKVVESMAESHPSYRPAADQQDSQGPDPLLNDLASLASEVGPVIDPPGHLELLTSITESARSLFSAAACSVALIDSESEELVFVAASGAGAAEVLKMRIPTREGIAGWVVSFAKSVNVADVSEDPRFSRYYADRTGFRPKGVLASPLGVGQTTLGVIEVLEPRGPTLDGNERVRLLEVFATQVSLALQAGDVFNNMGRALFQAGAAKTQGRLAEALHQVARDTAPPSREMAEVAATLNSLMRLPDAQREKAASAISAVVKKVEGSSKRTPDRAKGGSTRRKSAN